MFNLSFICRTRILWNQIEFADCQKNKKVAKQVSCEGKSRIQVIFFFVSLRLSVKN